MALKFFNTGEIIQDNFGQEFCFIPEGSFQGGENNDQEIEIKAPFYLATNPLNAALFTSFLKDSGYEYPKEELENMWKVSPFPDSPAVNISWLDAKEVCRWLRKKTGDYYSLPQNDEWEKAARSDDGRKYPWGDDEPNDDLAYFNHLNSGTTSQCNLRTEGASPYGCLDMAGNVWEWCIDSFDDERDPHILKGGSWQSDAASLENGSKIFSFPPEKRGVDMGMRLLYLPKGEMLDYYQRSYGN